MRPIHGRGPIDIPDDLYDSSDDELDPVIEINPFYSDENGYFVFYPRPPEAHPSVGRSLLWHCVPCFGPLLMSLLTLGVYLVVNMSPIHVYGNIQPTPGSVGPLPTLEVSICTHIHVVIYGLT